MNYCLPLVVTCETLPDIANGEVSLSGTQFGSVATYSCVQGYRVEGAMERTCLATGLWSDSPPLCQGLWVAALRVQILGNMRYVYKRCHSWLRKTKQSIHNKQSISTWPEIKLAAFKFMCDHNRHIAYLLSVRVCLEGGGEKLDNSLTTSMLGCIVPTLLQSQILPPSLSTFPPYYITHWVV